MKMTLICKNGFARFFLIEYLDTGTNMLKNNYYPESIKNDNGSVAMREKRCDEEGTNNSISLQRTTYRNITLFLTVPLCSNFIYFNETEGVLCYTKRSS